MQLDENERQRKKRNIKEDKKEIAGERERESKMIFERMKRRANREDGN